MASEHSSYLELHLQLLQTYQPKLAYQLEMCDPSDIVFCQTEQGEWNLKRTYQEQTYYYHSQEGALQEAQEWFSHLDIDQATLLYVYGIGLGYYYEAAKQWLQSNPERRLIFLEEDLAVLYRLLETKRAESLLKDPQVQLVYFTSLMADRAIFNELAWNGLFCTTEISSLKLYAEANQNGLIQLKHQLTHDAVQTAALVDEYLQYGIVFFRNFYPNLLELPKAYLGNALFGGFPQVPAIICGAGPSLAKNLDVLKTLKDQALIFAGGSALNALASNNFLPHFGAGVDPNQAQYERLSTTCRHPVPFFYRNRLFHDALKLIKGPRLYLTGSGGYDVAEWFEEQLGIKGENLDEGHNIVNFCIQIAHALGCNPIILVGVDLAFTGNKTYAEGIVEETHFNAQEAMDFDQSPIVQNDIHGQPVHTLWKWVTESEWVGEFAKNHPEVDFINATEGGIGFDGIPNMPLAQVKEAYLKPIENLQSRLLQSIQAHPLSEISADRIQELMQALKKSLENCVEHFSIISHELQTLMQAAQQGQSIPDSLSTPAVTLAEMEIEEEFGYQFVLNIFNLVYLKTKNRMIQDLHRRSSLPSPNIAYEKMTLQRDRIHFLRDVAKVNIELIKRTITNL